MYPTFALSRFDLYDKNTKKYTQIIAGGEYFKLFPIKFSGYGTMQGQYWTPPPKAQAGVPTTITLIYFDRTDNKLKLYERGNYIFEASKITVQNGTLKNVLFPEDFVYNNNPVEVSNQLEGCGYKTEGTGGENYSTAGVQVVPGNGFTARVTKENGTWKVKFTIKQSVPKHAKIPISEKTKIEAEMSRLATEKLNKLGGLDGTSAPEQREQTEDGGEFWVRKMNGRGWLGAIGELGSSVWENAALPRNYWNKDEGYNAANIHVPALFGGVADGGINLVSDYPQLVKLGYDVATEEKVREGLWNGVKNISISKVISFAKDEVKQKWDRYSDNTKPYVQQHELGKDGVAVVKFATGAGALVAGIKGAGEKFAKNADDILEAIVKRQKKLIEDVKAGKIDLTQGNSNFRKGNFGEMCTDVDLTEKGYKALHVNRVDNIDASMKQGIDGVFEKNGEYFIVESKYSGTSKLKPTNDGPQMGDVWIKNRLEKALLEEDFIKISGKKYKSILSEIAPDGKIIYKELDKNGKVIATINM